MEKEKKPRKTGQKVRLLLLKQIFERKTDENHALTAAKLIDELRIYGCDVEKRCIYLDIDALDKCGVGVMSAGRNTGYWLAEREFEFSEVKLLVDIVQSCKFMSQEKTKELINKLKGLCSDYQALELDRQIYTTNRVKTKAKNVFYNVDVIHKAINSDSMIIFRMRIYTPTKEVMYRNKGCGYAVSPYALIYSDDNYYLLGYDWRSKRFKHFRVDRMEQLRCVEQLKREANEEFAKIDMSAYNKYTFSMYGEKIGRMTIVKMRFKNRLTNVVMDKFGFDVPMVPDGNSHFTVSVPVAVSRQFYAWIFGLGAGAEILEPEPIKRRMKRAMDEIYYYYDDKKPKVEEKPVIQTYSQPRMSKDEYFKELTERTHKRWERKQKRKPKGV